MAFGVLQLGVCDWVRQPKLSCSGCMHGVMQTEKRYGLGLKV